MQNSKAAPRIQQQQPFQDAIALAKTGLDSSMRLLEIVLMANKPGATVADRLNSASLQIEAVNGLLRSFTAAIESMSREILRNQQEAKLRKRIPKRKRRKLAANPLTI